MFHLVYVSHASHPFHEEELIELLKKARQNNLSRGITGLLLYANQKFIQAIEGSEVEVNRLLDTIRRDQRHKRVAVVLEGEAPVRIFENWSMGFKSLTSQQFEDLSGFQDPDDFVMHARSLKPVPVLVFLQLFYKKNFVDHPFLT